MAFARLFGGGAVFREEGLLAFGHDGLVIGFLVDYSEGDDDDIRYVTGGGVAEQATCAVVVVFYH